MFEQLQVTSLLHLNSFLISIFGLQTVYIEPIWYYLQQNCDIDNDIIHWVKNNMIKIGKGHDHGIFLRLKEKFKID